MGPTRLLPALALCALALLGTTGCMRSAILRVQIRNAREASASLDSLHDLEVARHVAFAALGQFEGMHRLAPDNEDALFLLTRGWTSATLSFTEEDMEVAEDLHHKELADYHRQRAQSGYERAIQYGLELIAKRSEGFAEARHSDASLRAWLRQHFTTPEDAASLLWLGLAWSARTAVTHTDSDAVADLWVAVALLERSVELDSSQADGAGLVALATYHARSAQAELDESREYFQRAFEVTRSRSLLHRFQYATRYLCARADRAAYVKTLQEIVNAGDIFPERRLGNVIAKKRARRYLGQARLEEMRANCGFDGQ
jgi:hypothetical protein